MTCREGTCREGTCRGDVKSMPDLPTIQEVREREGSDSIETSRCIRTTHESTAGPQIAREALR